MVGLLATSLLASCNKKEDNNGGTADGMGFRAMTEQDGGSNSRTHGVYHSDGGNEWLEVQWTAGDRIRVNNGSETRVFELTSGENTTSGEFYTSDGPTYDFTTGDFIAIYPAANAEGVANTVDATSATFNLPATQTYSADHPRSFAEKAMPMMAHSNNRNLYFKNVLGGICFQLKGNNLHVSRLVLTSANPDEKLWGVFNADYDGGDPKLTHVSGGGNSITLTCDVTLHATNVTEFTIMVPPGTLETGFTVAAYDGDAEVLERTADWSDDPRTDFIPRSEILLLDDQLNVVISPLRVTTISPTYITDKSAFGGGIVEVLGKEVKPVTERGLCWALASVTTEPTLENSSLAEGQQTAGTYGFTFGTLTKDMVYYVRAYAKNSAGQVVYGEPIPFASRKDYPNDYDGKIPFAYSVATDKQVYFSMGNLQYKASDPTWRFAEYQFEYVGSQTPDNQGHTGGNISGSDNINASSTYDGWIDLFGWATTGCKLINEEPYFYQPWDSTQKVSTEYPVTGFKSSPFFGPRGANNLTGVYQNGDWGIYCSISNGGSAGSWHLMEGNPTEDDNNVMTGSCDCQWYYLLKQRPGQTCSFAQTLLTVRNGISVNGISVNGLMIFPDGFEWPSILNDKVDISSMNTFSSSGKVELNEAQWSLLEKQGAVFLPAAGIKYGKKFHSLTGFGRYWTSTWSNATGGYTHARNLRFNIDEVLNANNSSDRSSGYSVRLVQDVH